MLPWVYAFGFSLVPLILTKRRFVLEGFLTSCSFDYINRDIHARLSQICLVLGGFVLPAFILFLFYALALKEIAKKKKLQIANEMVDLMMTVNETKMKNENENESFTNEQSSLNMILIHLSIFILTWTPYAGLTLYAQFGTNIHKYITPFTLVFPSLFAKASLIYSPILLILFNGDARTFIVHQLKATHV